MEREEDAVKRRKESQATLVLALSHWAGETSSGLMWRGEVGEQIGKLKQTLVGEAYETYKRNGAVA